MWEIITDGCGCECKEKILMGAHIPGVGGVTMEVGDQVGVVCRVTK